MYCVKCGKLLDENDKFCSNCGKRISLSNENSSVNIEENKEFVQNCSNVKNSDYNANILEEKKDKANVFLVIISFFIPLVGLILFLAYNNEKPKFAKANGISALVGFIVYLIVFFIAIGLGFYYMFYDDYEYDNNINYYDDYEYNFEVEDRLDDIDEKIDEFLNKNKINLNNSNL